jgi:4-alpha-glucanotransferase
MDADSGRVALPPFPPDYRASGILLHVASLPSSYGIGDVGPAALAWVDQLREAGQSWWQALPLGPTGNGNSPYQPKSFAASRIDYGTVIPYKHRLLETAWGNFCVEKNHKLEAACQQFRGTHQHWLEDYALFRALKARYNDAYYLDWPIELVRRNNGRCGTGCDMALWMICLPIGLEERRQESEEQKAAMERLARRLPGDKEREREEIAAAQRPSDRPSPA